MAALAALAMAAASCGSAQKPVTLIPAGSAPAITAAAPAAAEKSAGAANAKASAASQPGPSKPVIAKGAAQSGPAQSTAAQEQETSGAQTKFQTAGDAVGDLIERVEKEYQAGLDNYHAGRLDAAKQNFDNAFNALLGSDQEIHSDGRLEKEFDRISEGVNHLELPGLAQADAGEQKSEPAPIDETNELTPAADPNIKAKALAEIKSTNSDLPLMMTDQVAGYITYFSNRGRENFEHALARSGRYQAMMRSVLKEQGIPQDLVYLAQAESGFHPLAVSKAGARGIWQFMASRGKGYGLEHNFWLDDRQDPEKSTRAAAHHLKDLYNQFGDWYLAMAAYNSGPGTVQAAVKRTGYADFWELYRRNVLPKETRNYVPIILAVTIMAKNPAQYGLDHVAMERPSDSDTVTVDYAVDLRLVAECVDTSVADLQALNPSLLRFTTPKGQKFVLHLPAGTTDQYETAIAAIPADLRAWWRYHKVQPGDTLASLARSYRVTAKAITETNHLDGGELEADAKLIIPIAPGKHAATDTAAYARHITRYKVRKGDTLDSVAEDFAIPAQMIRRWNGIRGESLRGRKVLALHLPVTPSTREDDVIVSHSSKPSGRGKAAAMVHHKVQTGETLFSIASSYNTTVEALKRDNRNVAVLRPGMILVVQPVR
jgi:membrane-bound lytic murein transglycosylase D